MDSKTIAVIVVFAALTIALNLSPVKIPAPYAPFLIYQIWEIPIVAASLLFGLRVGVPISVINTLVLLAVFPGELPTGPLYNLVAVLSMILGIFLVQRLLGTRIGRRVRLFAVLFCLISFVLFGYELTLYRLGETLFFAWILAFGIILFMLLEYSLDARQKVALPTAATTVGILFRVGVMTFVNWAFLPFPTPVGFNMPPDLVVAALPVIGFFNATLALYTVPAGYFIARVVGSGLKTMGSKTKILD